MLWRIESVHDAFIHDNYPVRVFHAGNTLGDDQLRRIGNLLGEGFSDFRICRCIHSAGTVVKNQDFRLFQKRAGNTQPLLLTAGTLLPPCSICVL